MTTRAWGSGETPADAGRYIRVAAYAVCVDAEQVLLARVAPPYPDAGAWTLPGGGLEFGERPEVGVVRELEEETGLLGEAVSLLAVDSEVYGPRPGRQSWLQSLRIVYRVRVTGGALRHEVDGSTDMSAWVPLADADRHGLVSLAALGVRLAREDVAA